ncbi:alpha/beta hydrolase [Mycolicibacterium arseniciresistens]|uniref:Alpha/beta hydrolase n=1 Tax=Mycolicibacterium arseniciresistens TaxID=3062257 RepID=A0ABT8UHZ9_9MYCO|nr:alpha/beta hydrolase [Mycolicibacterium arseniciresistens]MDO3637403.1 alpha/beta hydrolase [Mycolicibacterium arseniciresistens]
MRWVLVVTLVVSGLSALAWSQQRRLIYFPAPGPVPSAALVMPDGHDVELATADGKTLGAWYFPGRVAGPVVLVCNGNGGDRSGRAALALALHRMGVAVLLFDYRGYGGNPGRPTEDGLAADARAALDWLAARPEVDSSRIAYYGESLGAAVALGLAVDVPPAALILRSPFTSLADAGAVHYPWLPVRRLLIDSYPSIDRIGSLRAPLLVLAGDRDDVVPETMSRRLFDAAPEPKRYVTVPGAGHNDPPLVDGAVMTVAIEQFLASTPVLER